MPKADRRLDCDDGFEILNNIIITEYFFKIVLTFFKWISKKFRLF